MQNESYSKYECYVFRRNIFWSKHFCQSIFAEKQFVEEHFVEKTFYKKIFVKKHRVKETLNQKDVPSKKHLVKWYHFFVCFIADGILVSKFKNWILLFNILFRCSLVSIFAWCQRFGHPHAVRCSLEINEYPIFRYQIFNIWVQILVLTCMWWPISSNTAFLLRKTDHFLKRIEFFLWSVFDETNFDTKFFDHKFSANCFSTKIIRPKTYVPVSVSDNTLWC
jgi:hypothetical protein